MIKPLFLIFILSSILLVSCNNNDIVLTHKFEHNRWNALKKVQLQSHIADSEVAYKMTLNIKIDDKFNSDDFSISLSQMNDDGESRYYSYVLPIKDKRGDFLLKKANDGFYNYELVLHKHTSFYSDSIYHFDFNSMMSKLYINGIYELKLNIKEL